HHRTAQSVGNGWLIAGDPDCVADYDRIGGEPIDVVLDEVLKTRASDFFFELPNEVYIDGKFVGRRVSRGHQCGDRRSFIVGCSRSFISPILLVEYKWRLMPFSGISGLHINVIIDRDCRIAGPGFDTSKHDRITG